MKKLRTVTIEIEHDIDDRVHFMSFLGIPRKGIVKGFTHITRGTTDTTYYIEYANNLLCELSAGQMYETQEAMLKDSKPIAPNKAVKVLDKHSQGCYGWLDEDSLDYLLRASQRYKPKAKNGN